MANQSVTAVTGVTTRTSFFDYRQENMMFEVRAGLPIFDALQAAGALSRSIQDLALKGVLEGETSVDTSYLIWFASHAINGLIASTSHHIEFGHLRDRANAEAEA